VGHATRPGAVGDGQPGPQLSGEPDDKVDGPGPLAEVHAP
jgi:hypothetical protein